MTRILFLFFITFVFISKNIIAEQDILTAKNPKWVTDSTYKYRVKCDSAQLLINNPKIAIILFEQCLKGMESVGRYHGLFKPKRKARMTLIDLYIAEGYINKAYKLTYEWIKEDKYDLDAKIKYAHVLSMMKEHKGKAVTYYAKLFKEFYNVRKVAEPYLKFLLRNNMSEKADSVSDVLDKITH